MKGKLGLAGLVFLTSLNLQAKKYHPMFVAEDLNLKDFVTDVMIASGTFGYVLRDSKNFEDFSEISRTKSKKIEKLLKNSNFENFQKDVLKNLEKGVSYLEYIDYVRFTLHSTRHKKFWEEIDKFYFYDINRDYKISEKDDINGDGWINLKDIYLSLKK